MKVKIGNVVYDSDITPIMVVLTDWDKKNISKLKGDKYCCFADGIDPGFMQTLADFRALQSA